MRTTFIAVALPFAGVMSIPAASAEVAGVYGLPPLSDAALARVAGTGSPFGPLTRGQLGQFVEQQSRSDFRTADSGRIQMDVWWGTTGSELIANAVRSAP